MPAFVQSQSQDLLGGKKVAAGHRQEHSLAHKPVDKAAAGGPLADSRSVLDLQVEPIAHLARCWEILLASKLVAGHWPQTWKQLLRVQRRRTSVLLMQQHLG